VEGSKHELMLGTDPFISWSHRENTNVLLKQPVFWPRFIQGSSEIQNKHYNFSKYVYLQLFVCREGGCFRHT